MNVSVIMPPARPNSGRLDTVTIGRDRTRSSTSAEVTLLRFSDKEHVHAGDIAVPLQPFDGHRPTGDVLAARDGLERHRDGVIGDDADDDRRRCGGERLRRPFDEPRERHDDRRLQLFDGLPLEAPATRPPAPVPASIQLTASDGDDAARRRSPAAAARHQNIQSMPKMTLVPAASIPDPCVR